MRVRLSYLARGGWNGKNKNLDRGNIEPHNQHCFRVHNILKDAMINSLEVYLIPTMYLLIRSLVTGWLALSSFVRKAREKASYKLLFSDPQGLLLRALMRRRLSSCTSISWLTCRESSGRRWVCGPDRRSGWSQLQV